MGPLLFLIYINDLPLHVDSSCVDLYADDTTLHHSDVNLDDVTVCVNKDLANVAKWCDANRLIVNEKKTKSMLICSSQKRAHVNMNEFNVLYEGKEVEYCNEQKILGVHVDENLQWRCHIDHIIMWKTIQSAMFTVQA